MAGRKKIELGVGGHTDLRMTYVCAVRGMATSRLSHRSTVSRVRHYSAVADFFVTISACTGGGRRTTVREESSTAPLEMASVTRAQQAAGHQCHAWPTRTQRRRAAGVVACGGRRFRLIVRSVPGVPRLPFVHCITRACMSLLAIAFVLAGSLSALRTWVAHRSAYLRYVMPTFFQVLMAPAHAERSACESRGESVHRPLALGGSAECLALLRRLTAGATRHRAAPNSGQAADNTR